MKKILALIIVVCFVLPFATACAGTVTTPTTPPEQTSAAQTPSANDGDQEWDGVFKGEVKFAGVFGLTGSVPLEGASGRNGAQLAVEMRNEKGGANGYKVIFQAEDDGYENVGDVNVVSKLAADESVICMIGPQRSAGVAAISDIIKENKFPVLVAGTSIAIYEQGGGYIYRIRCCDKLVGGAAAEYLAGTVKAKKIGILYNNDDYGNGARQVIVDYLKEHYPDCEVAVESGHNTGDKDMTAGLLAIKEAGCDAMVVWTHSPEGAIIQRQFNELGMKDSVYFLGGPVWGMPGFHELVDDSIVDGITCVTDFAKNNDEPETQEFLKAYKAKYGIDADSFAAYYYDAANIAMAALELCGETFTREAFIAAVPKVQLNGVSGKIYCGEEGMDFIHRVVIGTISASNGVKDITDVQFIEFYD